MWSIGHRRRDPLRRAGAYLGVLALTGLLTACGRSTQATSGQVALTKYQEISRLTGQLTSAEVGSVLHWQRSLDAVVLSMDADPQLRASFEELVTTGNGASAIAPVNTDFSMVLLDAQSDEEAALVEAVKHLSVSETWTAIKQMVNGRLSRAFAGLTVTVDLEDAVQQTDAPSNWDHGTDKALAARINYIMAMQHGSCPGGSVDDGQGGCLGSVFDGSYKGDLRGSPFSLTIAHSFVDQIDFTGRPAIAVDGAGQIEGFIRQSGGSCNFVGKMIRYRDGRVDGSGTLSCVLLSTPTGVSSWHLSRVALPSPSPTPVPTPIVSASPTAEPSASAAPTAPASSAPGQGAASPIAAVQALRSPLCAGPPRFSIAGGCPITIRLQDRLQAYLQQSSGPGAGDPVCRCQNTADVSYVETSNDGVHAIVAVTYQFSPPYTISWAVVKVQGQWFADDSYCGTDQSTSAFGSFASCASTPTPPPYVGPTAAPTSCPPMPTPTPCSADDPFCVPDTGPGCQVGGPCCH